MSLYWKARMLTAWAHVYWTRASGAARAAQAQRSQFYRDLWSRTASDIGAEVVPLDTELLRITRGGTFTHVFRNYTDLDGPATLRAAGNKRWVHEILRTQAIPVPEFHEFSLETLAGAARFLQHHGDCVVKPAAGTGAGDGVTTHVATKAQLTQAAVHAAAYHSRLIVERQVAGENVRLLFLDGRLLDAIHRRPPSVDGDGQSSIATLVQRENQARLAGGYAIAQVVLNHDLEMRGTLAQQGHHWRSVPAAGQRVQLKTVINDNSAADNCNVTAGLCPNTISVARRAAQAVGVRLAGVDLILPQLDADLATSTGVVLEVNTTPGLYIHAHHSDCSSRVFIPILEACLANTRDLP